jgi:CRISPR-associated protein Cas1
MKDLHILPKVRDSWSYVYVEHAKIDQEDKAIALHDANGKVPVPCATLSLLLLGPGTSITHAAIRALADNGCMVGWCGEGAVRFYALGTGETRSAQRLLWQSWLCSDPQRRLRVVRRMYELRFPDSLDSALTLQQIRGKEGIRVREAYARASRATGVPWTGRSYQADSWSSADPVNRALSCANSCLYGVCHAAIVAAGYSPALGFIHTGKMLSFVYDIADLYKATTTIPAAFRAVAEGTDGLERRVRYACRDQFHSERILQRIVSDIDRVLEVDVPPGPEMDFDQFDALPGGLWDPNRGQVRGGVNHADGV